MSKKESNPAPPVMNSLIIKSFDILGHKVKDRVTGFSGVASSISFDLYGCVQVAVTPGMNKEGKVESGHWFDLSRLSITGKKVMKAPDFEKGVIKIIDHGPAEKPHM